MKLHIFTLSILLTLPLLLFSQEIAIKNIRTLQKQHQLYVYYDLISKIDNAYFYVNLKIEKQVEEDIEILEPTIVLGAVGGKVQAGKDKVIIWEVLKEPNIPNLAGIIRPVLSVDFQGYK